MSGNVEVAKQNLQVRHTYQNKKMVLHKCFECDREIKAEYIKKKIRCPYCGSKILYKPRVINSKVKTE